MNCKIEMKEKKIEEVKIVANNFTRRLIGKIKIKEELYHASQQFQDLHWDDSYEVYYDSSK